LSCLGYVAMSVVVLSPAELQIHLTQLTGWFVVDGKLRKQFQFKDFMGAFGFMTQMALVSERMGHHPEWFNVYNKVVVDLVTHDAGGITQKDLDWAQTANQLRE
jgi:4a-hydroxytetrahydrobiopterin dehydratase